MIEHKEHLTRQESLRTRLNTIDCALRRSASDNTRLHSGEDPDPYTAQMFADISAELGLERPWVAHGPTERPSYYMPTERVEPLWAHATGMTGMVLRAPNVLNSERAAMLQAIVTSLGTADDEWPAPTLQGSKPPMKASRAQSLVLGELKHRARELASADFGEYTEEYRELMNLHETLDMRWGVTRRKVMRAATGVGLAIALVSGLRKAA